MDGQELKVHKEKRANTNLSPVCFQDSEGLEMGEGEGIKAENLAGTRSWRIFSRLEKCILKQ